MLSSGRLDMGVPTTRVRDWDASGGWAPWFDFGPPNRQSPGRTRFVNGNFAFTRGQWNVEVPQDPDHYYWGEEFSISVRSFTWGYDLFLPTEVAHRDQKDVIQMSNDRDEVWDQIDRTERVPDWCRGSDLLREQ